MGPLLMFTPKMAAAKRKGLTDYAQVAQGYVDGFEEKWVLDTRRRTRSSDLATFSLSLI
jgi:hypothetical protein